MRLDLRPVRPTDEQVVRDAHEQLRTDNFEFALGLDNDMTWADYIELLDQRLTEPPEPWVPSTFLLAAVDGDIVGRTSIRHRLNDYLQEVGGHIGFGVLPMQRRRGYATEILRQSIVIARSHGVDRVLVTCDEDNTASAQVITRCGGVLENIVDDPLGGPPTQRYWIT
ncbi:MAG: GNAT family N-acetyltransferase [Actinomycetota bacterium]